MGEISRREFVVVSVAVAGAAAVGVAQTTGPSSQPSAEVGGLLDGGAIKELKTGYNTGLLKGHKIVVVVADGKAFAESAICTHKGCTLKVGQGAGGAEQLRCPCHGSKFDEQGYPTSGPAKSQLTRYGVTEKEGRIWVDPDKIILPGDFEKEGAFVEMPK
jgi:nitrite reductase/ring-hydroxylating ferredoxin subunit